MLIALLVATCGGRSPDSSNGLDRPPDLIVAAGDEQLALVPFSYCWSVGVRGVCADGTPPDPLLSLTLGSGTALMVEFSLPWEIQATLVPNGDYCDGPLVVDLDPTGASVETLGPAGTYRVDVFGRGEQGDAAWSFDLVTTEDRSWPAGYMQAFWFPGGQELERTASFNAYLGNLTERPNNVSAAATVTASDGKSQAFIMISNVVEDCWESTIKLEAPADFTSSVLGLGAPPYEVVISVSIDGRDVVEQAITWPNDYPSNSNESHRVPLPPTSE